VTREKAVEAKGVEAEAGKPAPNGGLIDIRPTVTVRLELPESLQDLAVRATFLSGAMSGVLLLLAGHFLFGRK
jgi:hypothetical protein